MRYSFKTEANVGGLGRIFYTYGTLEQQLKLFEEKGLEIITARDLAYARIQKGADNPVNNCGSWIREGVVYNLPLESKTVLVRDSPILKDPSKAVEASKNGKEFFLAIDDTGAYLDKIGVKDDSVLVLTTTTAVPTNRFGEDERTVWLFKDQAQQYGLYLEEQRIRELGLLLKSYNYIINQNMPFGDQLWLCGLRDNSKVVSYERTLSSSHRARGVLRETSEASAQLLAQEVERALKIVGGVRMGELPASQLEKVIGLLQKMKKK